MALSNLFSTMPVGQPTQVGQPVAAQPAGLPSYFAAATTATPLPNANTNYTSMLQGSLDSFMAPNSPLITQARQRGMEVAATRGGVNSSIAAGAAERAALDQAIPLAQTAVGMEAGKDQARIQNWLAQQGFNREMAAAPFSSSLNMLGRVTEMAIQDPELYSPSVVSGFTNFYNQQMDAMMKRYFGG